MAPIPPRSRLRDYLQPVLCQLQKGECKTIRKFLKENGVFLIVLLLILFINAHFPKYYIQTGSMEPTLHVGAVVMIDKNKAPDVSDIAAYESGGNIVVHRVVAETDEGYIFKGDANAIEDASVITEDQIKGTVILKINFIAPIVRQVLQLEA